MAGMYSIANTPLPRTLHNNTLKHLLKHDSRPRWTRSQCTASVALGEQGSTASPGPQEPAKVDAEWDFQGRKERTDGEVRRAKFRAILFFTLSMIVAIPLLCVMCVMHPLVIAFDRYRRRAQHLINKIWASLSMLLFNRIEVEGWENVPDNKHAAVYVANHESYMDIFTLFHLGKDFKFVSKRSIFSIPVVGWSMWLTGHMALDRTDAAGFRDFVKKGRELLENGASLIVFPEGTRSVDGKLSDFKKGAFTIATKAKVPLVPITILGTGDIMPSGHNDELHTGPIKIIVHPPISTRNKKTSEVVDACRDAIASRLPTWKLA